MIDRHFYRVRFVKGGPYVALMTFFGSPLIDGEEIDRSPRWQALVHPETSGRAVLMGGAMPIEVDGIDLRNIESVSEDEYLSLVTHPAAAPWVAVDVRRMPSIF